MPIATAEELCAASDDARHHLRKKSREDQLESWLHWFEKRIDQMLRDAVRKGLYHIFVELPFQPLQGDEQKRSYRFADGEHISTKVKRMLEGISLDYTELEEDGKLYWILEIRWD